MDASAGSTRGRDPWNKGRLIGQKLPLKLKEIWAIRIRLQLAERLRDLALCSGQVISDATISSFSAIVRS